MGMSISDFDSAIASAPTKDDCCNDLHAMKVIDECKKAVDTLSRGYAQTVIAGLGGHLIINGIGVLAGAYVATFSLGGGLIISAAFLADTGASVYCAGEATGIITENANFMKDVLCHCEF